MNKDIYIHISRKKSDDQDDFWKIFCDIAKKCGCHEKDQIWLSDSEEHPYMNHWAYPKLESVWTIRFFTKDIQNRHKKIFKALQRRFLGRHIYCPEKESGWRLFLTRLASHIFIIRNFIKDINVQRLNEEEKKSFQKIKQKYSFAFELNDLRLVIQKLIRKKGMLSVIRKFDIISLLRKLENNPEIDTDETQRAVVNILEILNKELFISQFEWTHKSINKLWKKKFGWHLFRDNDVFDSLQIPKDIKEFNIQLQYLHRILVESLNNEDLKKNLEMIGVKDTELKNEDGQMKKSIFLLDLWISKKLKKDELEIIEFLRLLHNLRGKATHSLKARGLSGEKDFKKIVKFCQRKQTIQSSHTRSELFKAILKTSELLLCDLG